MNDFEALTAWIQPRHLSASEVDGYRTNFESRPLRVLHITDFLQADIAARIARFLGREATYEQVYALYADYDEERVAADVWRIADKASRYYSLGELTGPDPRFRLSPNLFTFLNFRKMLATSAFKAYVSASTGLPLGDVGKRPTHRMRRGDLLGPHDDRFPGRRLTFIFYFSPDWKPDYGGALQIIGKHDECTEIEATFNSFLVFDVTTQKSHYGYLEK